MKNTDIKQIVKDSYKKVVVGDIAESGCCSLPGQTCGEPEMNYTMFKDKYDDIKGYVKEADYGLGCGIPTKFITIKEDDRVLDLGSGAGNDVFIARELVGPKGVVIGLDMTEEMVSKANANKRKLGFENVEFLLGEIESMPIESDSINVVISNCVLNLVPDKEKAFKEIYRVLASGGTFSISDIVLDGQQLPKKILESAQMYAGCISGAIQKTEYINLIKKAGFKDVKIKSTKEVTIHKYLKDYLNEEELNDYERSASKIESITLVGSK